MSSTINCYFFKPDFYFLVKSKMATIVGDVTGFQQSHHPKIYLVVENIKGFILKAKAFRNTTTHQ